MTTLLKSVAVHTLSAKSVAAKCARWALAAAIGGLAIGSSDHANAQVSFPAPNKLPDLSMTARNLMPPNWIGRKVPTDTVTVIMDLAGLEPLFVQPPTGFTCQFGAR